MVSEICLGTMTFGSMADETTSRRILDQAVDAGVDFRDVEEVDAALEGVIQDAQAGRLVGHRAEGHGAEADLRDQQARLAESTSLHARVCTTRRGSGAICAIVEPGGAW